MGETNNTDWHASALEAKSDPIYDPGTGQQFIIRQFRFFFNPDVLKQIKDKKLAVPSKQDLFNSVWGQIRIALWKDGLVAIEESDFPPRVIVSKKDFKVFLVCQPKFRTAIVDKAQNLTEIMNPKP